MIEVHLVRLKDATAIRARNTAEFAKEFERRGGPHLNAPDLPLAVRCVVANVERPLISGSPGHQFA